MSSPRRPSSSSSPTCPRPLWLAGELAYRVLVRTSLWTAGGIAALARFDQRVMELPDDPRPILLLFLSAFVIYNLDHLVDAGNAGGRSPWPGSWVLRSLLLLAAGAVVGLLVAAPPAARWVFAAYVSVGLLHGLPLLPFRVGGHRARLKDIPLLKSWMVAGAVTLAVVGLPVAYSGTLDGHLRPPRLPVVIFTYVLTVSNAHLFDVRDVDEDRAQRVWTLPVAAGLERTREAVLLLNLVLLALMSWGWAEALLSRWPEILLSTLAMVVVALSVRRDTPRRYYEIVVEGCLYLPLLFALVFHGAA